MMMSVLGLPLVPCGRPHSHLIPQGWLGTNETISEDSSRQGLMCVRLNGQSSEK